MRTSFIKLFTALSAIIVLASCHKTNQEAQQTTEQLPTLLKVTLTGDTTSNVRQETFSYDAQGNMTKIVDESWDTTIAGTTFLNGSVDLEAQPDGLPYTSHYTSNDRGVYLTIQYVRLPGHDLVQKRTYAPGTTLLHET